MDAVTFKLYFCIIHNKYQTITPVQLENYQQEIEFGTLFGAIDHPTTGANYYTTHKRSDFVKQRFIETYFCVILQDESLMLFFKKKH